MTDTQHDKLPVLTLDGPVWLGPWHQETPRHYMRALVKLCRTIPASCHVTITQRLDGSWMWSADRSQTT